MLRKCPALAIAIAVAVIATNADAQRRSVLRQLDDKEAKTLLAASTLTQTPAQSKYLHRVTEMTMGDGVKARVETWVMAPDKILNMVWFPGLGTSQTGYDGTIGWSVSPLIGAVLLQGGQVRVLVAGIKPKPVIYRIVSEPSADDATLYANGTSKIDGRVVNTFLLVENGDSTRIYLDAETGLLAAYRPLHLEKDRADTTSLTLLGDYKGIDGVLQPMKTTVRGKGRDFVSRIVAIDHEPIDSVRFVPPLAVRRLLADKP